MPLARADGITYLSRLAMCRNVQQPSSKPIPEGQARTPRFAKRSYTFGGIIRDLAIAFRALPVLIGVMKEKGQSITPQFKERVILAVTAVNKCRYCSFIHSRLA